MWRVWWTIEWSEIMEKWRIKDAIRTRIREEVSSEVKVNKGEN